MGEQPEKTPPVAISMPISIAIPTTDTKSSLMGGYTVYIIELREFGQLKKIERRYDDFFQLYKNLTESCPQAMTKFTFPEKKYFGNTSPEVIEERRHHLEQMLQGVVRCEEIVLEKSSFLWKFLECAGECVLIARCFCQKDRLRYVNKLPQVLEEKYKEERWRLNDEGVIRIILSVLDPGALPDAAGNPAEVAAAQLLEAIVRSSEEGQQYFLQHHGLRVVFSAMLQRVEVVGPEAGPREEYRRVIAALLSKLGDRFGIALHSFLAEGGMSLLSQLAAVAGIQEFVAKMLWLSFGVDNVRQLVVSEGLRLLNNLFTSANPKSVVMTGCLIAVMISAGEFAEDKAAACAAGLHDVLTEHSASTSQEIQQFVRAVFKPEKSVQRLADALETSSSETCAFVLWVLLVLKPAGPTIQKLQLRDRIAHLTSGEVDPQVRAMAADLVLHCVSEDASWVESSGDGPSAAAEESMSSALAACKKQELEQLGVGLLDQRDELVAIKELSADRVASPEDVSFEQFRKSRERLRDGRSQLVSAMSDASGVALALETRLKTLNSKRKEVGERGADAALLQEMAALDTRVDKYREARAAFEETGARLKAHEDEEQLAKKALADAEASMESVKACITRLEADAKRKEKEGQRLRTVTSSDVNERKSELEAELQAVMQKMAKVKASAEAAKQAGNLSAEDRASVNEEMKKNKEKVSQIQEEMNIISQSPEKIAERAAERDAEAEALLRQRDGRREELQQEEALLRKAKEAWQQCTTDLIRLRAERDVEKAKVDAAQGQLNCKGTYEKLAAHHKRWHELVVELQQSQGDDAKLREHLVTVKRELAREASRRAAFRASIAELIHDLQQLDHSLGQIDDAPSERFLPPDFEDEPEVVEAPPPPPPEEPAPETSKGDPAFQPPPREGSPSAEPAAS